MERIVKRGTDKFDVVVVDEAHRFRNELTQSYETLHAICKGKKVVLVSATPLNNRLDDILSQLKLFQPAKKSSIPGVPNLEKFFQQQKKVLNEFEDKGSAEYLDAVKRTSEAVRDRVLKHVMVRRTRSEIKRYFSKDLSEQGLTFPDMDDPERIIYCFDDKTDKIFNETIELVAKFSYARYMPVVYLKQRVSEFDKQSQRNVGGFMKGILIKRLESSFFAFKQTLSRFIISYEKFIEMYQSGTVYISKDVDVYDLLDSDDELALQQYVEEEKAQKYASKDFLEEFIECLKLDLDVLRDIQNLWKDIDDDPKLDQFISELKSNKLLKDKRLIVFTESKETGDYLYQNLDAAFPGWVFRYSSGGGTWNGNNLSVPAAREIITANYDPSQGKFVDDVKVLITTDVLAEGINLHRSNILINYDLPWNPTRVLQRVGRVNRVGTLHPKIHVFNFFPTAQSDTHLGLEDNIIAKLQAFHNTLGEDAKYLSTDEELSTHELFGDRLFKKLNDKSSLEESDEEESELKYLEIIRDIRDEQPDLFEKIKHLPRKARTAKEYDDVSHLMTFFRKGKLKKFVYTSKATSEELTFFEAAKKFECKPATKRVAIPSDYFSMLDKNKTFLDQLSVEEEIDMTTSRGGGASNEAFIIKSIKAIRKFQGFTDDDEHFLMTVLSALESGEVPKNTSKRTKSDLKGNLQPLKVLSVLRKNMDVSTIHHTHDEHTTLNNREVILSEYLVKRESS